MRLSPTFVAISLPFFPVELAAKLLRVLATTLPGLTRMLFAVGVSSHRHKFSDRPTATRNSNFFAALGFGEQLAKSASGLG